MQHKSYWWVAAFVATLMVAPLLLGFQANPAPQPQRVSDLVARIDALEEQNRTQQAALDDLGKRVEVLEQSGGGAGAIVLDDDVTVPKSWVKADSSDGIVRYRHDPDWELTGDEPGALDLWLDENTAIFYTWDWAYDLLDDINSDEEFLHFFEKDLISSDDTIKMKINNSGQVKFMGADAHYWDISVESSDGYASRMLSVFYPCNDRSSCNALFVRYDPDPQDDEALADFTHDDWAFVNTFAHGVEFLIGDKATAANNANLRSCPRIDCKIVGQLLRGEIVDLAAVSEDGLWFQLESGEWVAAGLIIGAPLDLPVNQDNSDT